MPPSSSLASSTTTVYRVQGEKPFTRRRVFELVIERFSLTLSKHHGFIGTASRCLRVAEGPLLLHMGKMHPGEVMGMVSLTWPGLQVEVDEGYQRFFVSSVRIEFYQRNKHEVVGF